MFADELSGVAALGFLIIIGFALVALPLVALLLVSYWKLLVKAGKPGWYSLIPVLNTVTIVEVAGFSPWCALVFLLIGVPYLNIVAIVACLALGWFVARSFGKNPLFCFATAICPIVCIPIIAFGASQYVPRNQEA